MSNLFAKLEKEAFKAGITPRTRESREWFRKKVQRMRSLNPRSLMRDEKLEQGNDAIVGNMYMFFYDPKTKEKLPYYDTFPLSIVVAPANNGFYGLNLHYLPPTLRAKFLDGLLEITNNSRYDNSTKLRISYNYLQRAASMKYYKPCFKHYLTDHVKGNFARVSASEYEIAVFLPTAKFQGASLSQVYKDSRRIINAI